LASIGSAVKGKIEDYKDRKAIERYYAEKAKEATSQVRSKKYEEEMQRRLSRSSASSTPTSSAPSETDSQAGGSYMDGLSNIMPFVQLYK
jgi:hypothetical protein